MANFEKLIPFRIFLFDFKIYLSFLFMILPTSSKAVSGARDGHILPYKNS